MIEGSTDSVNVFGNLLPVDGFKVKLNHRLTDEHHTSLILLYQPLIGIEATLLYQLLRQQSSIDKPNEIKTHHVLMNYLNLPLNVIYRARLKLEGIGLLKSFQVEEEERNIFLYEIYSPFPPELFFDEVLLAELLYHHLGESQFNKLKNHFTLQHKDEVEIGENVTAKFNDIFSTIIPTEAEVSPNILLNKSNDEQNIDYDFSELETTLKQQMIPAKKVLTQRNRSIFVQLKELYDLEDYEMEKALIWSLTEENQLDIDQFRAICLDIFKGKSNNVKIQLTDKQQKPMPEKSNIKTNSSQDKKTKLKNHLTQVTPKELLEDLSAGKTAAIQDLKMISEIMTKQQLPQGVMNVAVYYCMLQSNMQLSRAYLEKIASHWSRLKVKTVDEAMEIATSGTRGQVNNKRSYQQKRQNTHKEVVPGWFKKQQDESSPVSKQKNSKTREEILDMLKKMND